MKRTFVYATVLIAGSAVAAACGGSDSSSGKITPEAGTGKASGGSTGASAGGASSSGGKANGGGANVGAGGGAITGCDMSTCTGKKVFGQVLDACCVSATACGVSTSQFMGGQCFDVSLIANLPAEVPEGGGLFPTETIVPDPTCPDTNQGGMLLKGCCDKTNFCGAAIDSMQLTACLTPADIAAFAGGMGGFDAGTPQACTYPK